MHVGRILISTLCIASAGSISLSLASDESLVIANRGSTAAGVRALVESAFSSADLVRAALNEAASGDISRRNSYLAEAIERNGDFAPARWQAGYLREGEAWLTIDEAARLARDNELLVEYRQMRAATADTVAAQLKLARWCRKNGLKDEERAHLVQVLLKDPNNSSAHTALGDRLVQGVWISAEEFERAHEQLRRTRDALTRWGSYLEATRLRLEESDPRYREAGRERLRAVADLEVIPAMERVLSRRSENLALEVLGVLEPKSHPDATLSIVRHAVLSQWECVRTKAAGLLKARPYDHFVPMLISTLRGPIESQYAVNRRPDGRLLYEHILFREGSEANQLIVFESLYSRRVRSFDGTFATQRALEMIERDVDAREHMVAAENMQTSVLNARITAALNAATDANLGSEPNSWWEWWADQNGIYYVRAEKPVSTTRFAARLSISDPVSSGMECLAAGTPVWTSTGPVPIEEVRAGDRVLSQNPETGELALKPVLRTTFRPPSEVVTIRVNSEAITASEGHPFWVNGTGWVVARQLKDGDMLSAIGGGHAIESSRANAEEASTHNLAVADFHTFFIGDNRLLVHDVTGRSPTNAKVPGQR